MRQLSPKIVAKLRNVSVKQAATRHPASAFRQPRWFTLYPYRIGSPLTIDTIDVLS